MIRPLPTLLAEKAKKELNEDPKTLEKDLQYLKNWIAQQPHLNARTDDQWLVAFLRGCKYSLEKTKEKLDLYYTIRNTAPEIHQFTPSNERFEEVLSLGVVITLPKLPTPDGPRITLVRPGRYNADKYDINDILSVANILQKVLFMEDDNIIVAGTITILDLEGVTLGHFLQMTPTVLKKMVVAQQDAIPIRLKGTHYLNTPPGFETLFMAMKSLLNEKNRNRLYVHNKNFDALYKHVPLDILPAEYGGNGGTTEEILDGWRKKIAAYSKFLEEDVVYGTDESKRYGKPKTREAMLGLEGSFRQLHVD